MKHADTDAQGVVYACQGLQTLNLLLVSIEQL